MGMKGFDTQNLKHFGKKETWLKWAEERRKSVNIDSC